MIIYAVCLPPDTSESVCIIYIPRAFFQTLNTINKTRLIILLSREKRERRKGRSYLNALRLYTFFLEIRLFNGYIKIHSILAISRE